MLMITCIKENDTTRTLKLEGKLQGPWVREFKVLVTKLSPCRFAFASTWPR